MYEDNNWNAVTGDELAGFFDQINPIDGKYRTSPQSTQVHWRTLPFYETAALIRVKDSNWEGGEDTYYLTDQGSLYRLNGTTPPIHEVNSKAPIKLNEGSVADYVRFFCFFTHGDRGPFHVVESMSDPNVPRELDSAARSALESSIKPVSIEGQDEEGRYICKAVVFYANEPFMAMFAVPPKTGVVEMLEAQSFMPDVQEPTQHVSPAAG